MSTIMQKVMLTSAITGAKAVNEEPTITVSGKVYEKKNFQGEGLDALMNVKKHTEKQDELALKIFKEIVQKNQNGVCDSLEDFISKTVDSPALWSAEDATFISTGTANRKFKKPHMVKNKDWENDVKKREKQNADIVDARKRTKIILESVQARKAAGEGQHTEETCALLWDMVISAENDFRVISPWELTALTKSGLEYMRNKTGKSVADLRKGYNMVKYKTNDESTSQRFMFNGAETDSMTWPGSNEQWRPEQEHKKGRDMSKEKLRKQLGVEMALKSFAAGVSVKEIDGLKNFFAENFFRQNFRAKAMLFRSAESLRNPLNPGTHFRQCNVTFIGGVSGSILEQLAFAEAMGVKVTDEFALALMSILVLGGHHSLSEAYITTRRYFEVMGKFEDNLAKVKDAAQLGNWAKPLRQVTKQVTKKDGEESKFGRVAAALSLDTGCEEIQGFSHVAHQLDKEREEEKLQLDKEIAGDTEERFLKDFEKEFLKSTTA